MDNTCSEISNFVMATNLKQKKILVTGGAGFVGRHLVKNLIEKRGVLEKNIFVPRSSDLDLRIKENAERAVRGMDVVFHLAALSGGIGFSASHPGRMFYDNAVMGLNIIEAARAAKVEKFINIGSYNEYPKSAPMPLKEDDLWNGLPEESFLSYGMAKKMLLIQLQSYRKESNFNGIHLIMASMFGPGYDPTSTTLIPSLIRQIEKSKKEGLPVIGWGTGKATRDFLYVEDAVEGMALAAEKYDKPEPVNIGSGQEAPIKEIITALCELMEFGGELKWDPAKPEGQLRYIMDSSKAQKEFEFKAAIDIHEGLKRTIEFYKVGKL